MSALGQKQTSDCRRLMSALPPKAEISRRIGMSASLIGRLGSRAWIEDTNGNAIDEKDLKMTIRSHHEEAS
jgi:hypothetical protein